MLINQNIYNVCKILKISSNETIDSGVVETCKQVMRQFYWQGNNGFLIGYISSTNTQKIDMTDNKKQGAEKERRKVLKSTLAGGAVITASIAPEKWTKPVLSSVVLPAHATTSDVGAGMQDPDPNTVVNVTMSVSHTDSRIS